MEKISISNVIEFKRKPQESKSKFINKIFKPKLKSEQKHDKGGGDYWIHSLSEIRKTFVSENKDLIKNKLYILNEKIDKATAKISKDMFQRNIEILHNFEDFNFSNLKPKFILQYLPKPKDKSIIPIKGIPIQILPNHVFTYEDNNINKIGAIWFVSKLKEYNTAELGIFAEALFRYLEHHYSNDYKISSEFCTSVDVRNLNIVSYDKIINNQDSSILNSTLVSIREYLKNS